MKYCPRVGRVRGRARVRVRASSNGKQCASDTRGSSLVLPSSRRDETLQGFLAQGERYVPPLPPLRGSSNKLEEFPVRVYIGFNDGGVKNERKR